MKRLFAQLLQDQAANPISFKSKSLLFCFRAAQWTVRQPRWRKYLFAPVMLLYYLYSEFLTIELPSTVIAGPGLRIFHGQALVVNPFTIIGADCALRNSTTIGNKQLRDGTWSAPPVIGDHVDIGSNAVIIGPLQIGDYVIIGAGSVVVADVPAGAIVAGNPARIIRMRDDVLRHAKVCADAQLNRANS